MPWPDSVAQAKQLQQRWRDDVVLRPLRAVQTVAAADISFDLRRDYGYAAVVVMQLPGLQRREVAFTEGPLTFPYVPGYLSFREVPLIFAAMQKLEHKPDVLLCDGQGIAHPRRFGLACHLGVLLQCPTIGCAKSKLVGTYEEPAGERGASSPLVLGGEQVGMVLRTRDGVKPVFVSPGHLTDLASAERIVRLCLGKYRIPQPLREAHTLVNERRRSGGASSLLA